MYSSFHTGPKIFSSCVLVKNIEKFLKIISLGIARVYVCLDQFEVLQFKNNGQFDVASYRRKELICDMQKPKNQLKTIQYYFEILENS